MLGSSVLEVAIGMVLIYLLLSVICSALKEWIAGIFKWRASTLERGISELFASPEGQAIRKKLYAHALIKGLTQQGKLAVSYIPSRVFTLALLDILAPADADGPKDFKQIRAAIAGQQCTEIKEALLPLIDSADNDLKSLRAVVSGWFDDAMERVSGQYKAHAQCWIVALALLLCVSLNADSITIARTLWESPTTRAVIVADAEKETGKLPQGIAEAYPGLSQLGLPLGWSKATPLPGTLGEGLLKILGLLLTTIAVSLNAPFWFDILNKLVNLRMAGEKPEKASEAAAKDKNPDEK